MMTMWLIGMMPNDVNWLIGGWEDEYSQQNKSNMFFCTDHFLFLASTNGTSSFN